jgi:hypothetical protein
LLAENGREADMPKCGKQGVFLGARIAWQPVAKVIRAGNRAFQASSSLAKLNESIGDSPRFAAST